MNFADKITNAHRERLAVVYIRQSTIAQVRDHTESTARQYALAEEAVRLGWDHARIVVIDADLGVSGRTASARSGFKELVGRVCIGEVGAIIGIEVSRLARSCADLQRLLELCSLTDTLIIDADGTYDLTSFNDRLLLGLKGTMSEAELHVLAGRLQGAKRAAAQRGELRFPLPVGYVYDDDGATAMDTDEEIRSAVADVFAAFDARGSAYGVVAAFVGRRFPRRAYGGAWAGEVRWDRLTHSRVLGLLANPAYAGAYVFGRHHSRRTVQPDGTIRIKTVKRPREEWAVLIRDHHPAYIAWETFLANQERVANNCTQRGARPVREGNALLQGIVRCGGCGKAMLTAYPGDRGIYDCAHARSDHMQTPVCRSIVATVVDRPVVERLLATVAPQEIALALAAADTVAERRTRSKRAIELRVERARYEAARAERAFHHCDPDNRLVARSLEQRWEEKLQELLAAQRELACEPAESPMPTREQIEALARDLPRLWAASTTAAKDRKRLLRALIADVTITSLVDENAVRVGIHWRSGATEAVVVARPPSAAVSYRTPGSAVVLARRLGSQCDDMELAARLNAAGLLTGKGRPFDTAAVRWIRYAYDIASPPLLTRDEHSVQEVASSLGISVGVIYRWIDTGQLVARKTCSGPFGIPFTPEIEQVCRERVAQSTRMVRRTQDLPVAEAV
jgi:DNA invertase Pin-like site-specific DNA recombinase